MQKFRFSLQPVLQKRKLIYEQISRDLAIAQQKLQVEIEKLTDLKNKGVQLEADLKSRKQHHGFKAVDWATYAGYIQYLNQKVQNQMLITEKSEQQVQLVRQEMQRARTEYEVMIKMREKAQLEHRQQFLKEEQDFLDDLPKSNYVGPIL